ncbi:MAG TPA: bifunctional phosphopantothenoylcysteine decarboxylase/phosphopantothenate--cysteine ligase CoaBC [Gemmatimonadales bacterium]|nr:bifunctional phosphopantothenoylcysteine decarboxylase/phosphopantothenate--cysteine ligase CoaBC [Gemmatimonadales bacterium]
MSAWRGRRVVLGVSGGIACYKSCVLARRLAEAGALVDTVLTEAAAEFVRPLTFEALTGRPVLSSLWSRDGALAHVRLGRDADLVIVAPATANLIARVAQGIADDFLTAMLLARTAPVLLAPAMNDEMYAAAPTRTNLATLAGRGFETIGPEIGALAEGPSDRPGRMSEPEAIFRRAAQLLVRTSALAGRRVVVTAGPTRESIDPVRVITNRSSGRMGYAIAEAASARGADVLLISGPSTLTAPAGIEYQRIESTAELERAVRTALPAADVLVMAAAPADYRPARSAVAKIPREGRPPAIELEPTADILTGTKDARRHGGLIVGFALETGDSIAKGRAKLERKALDLIVVNDALEPGAGFETETNRVTILGRDGTRVDVPLQSKRDVADALLDEVEKRIGR